MKFIIEKKALTRMLRVLGSDPTRKAHDSVLRLAAQDGQIILHAYETEAGCEALVLEEGVCFFRITQFLPLVRTYASAKNLTMEVTPDGIQIGSTKISREFWEVSLFQNPRTAPLKLASGTPEAKATAPADQPFGGDSDATWAAFPIAEDELQLVQNVIRHTRRFCVLPTVTPPQLVGLGRALFALERLPRISKDVDVEFSLGITWGSLDDYISRFVTYHISEGTFCVGTMSFSSDPAAGDDRHTTTVYKVDNKGERSMTADDVRAWAEIFGWNKHVCGLLDQNPQEDLILSVYDSSKPDCMKACEGE